MLIFLGFQTMKIHFEGFTAICTPITEEGGGAWFSGVPGDWQWSIEHFGMSWGVEETLGSAIRASKAEIFSLNADFVLNPYEDENDRLNDCYFIPKGTEINEF